MTLAVKTIRGYDIGERIGSGGYGEVYRARQVSVDREVAIKIILPEYANDPRFRADFEAEARLVAQLEHADIVPLIDYWQDETGAYLVMRYIRGGSLKDMIDRQGQLPLMRTIRLIEQVANALAFAHDTGVVHRDLKPANILIDQRGNAYLTDFGIAKQLTSDGDSGGSGSAKGTFAYMSPEQIQGEKVSPQTDIYALGVMLYEMLAGQHPFHETPVGALLIKHMQEPLPNIHDIRDDLPADINNVIQRATSKAPADRYESVFDVVNDLKAAVSGTPAFVSQPTTPVQKKPTTTEERNRDAMLQNVRKFWIEGVLENSLHNTTMIELDLKPDSGAVDNPWDTLIRTPSGNETLTDERVIDIFDRLNGKVLILGDPGGGKTTTLLTLARDLLHRAEADTAHPIPAVLNLSSWSETQLPLTDWIVEDLNTKYQVPRNVGQNWVENDTLLLLLDGLDEVAPKNRSACVAAINAYRQEHGFVDVVVCSRIGDYEMLDTQLIMNGAVIIQPLNRAQVEGYFERMGNKLEPIVQLLHEDEALFELCQSPLMVSIIALTYGDGKVVLPEGTDVETLRRAIFVAYVDRAFEREPDSTVYPVAYVRRQLVWLARQMQTHGQSIFQIEALQPTWLGGDRPHNFTRRYAGVSVLVTYVIWTLATIFYLLPNGLARGPFILRSLLGGLMGVGFGIAITNKAYNRWWMILTLSVFMFVGLVGRGEAVTQSILPAVAYGIFYAATLNILKNRTYDPDVITPVERLSFSPLNVRYVPVVAASLVISLIVVRFQTPYEHPDRFLLAYFAVIPLAIVVVTILAGLGSPTVGDSSRPNQGILSSVRNGFLMGSITSLLYFSNIFISQIILNNLSDALLWGLFSMMWFFWWVAFLVGLSPAIQHLILRWMLHRREGIPWNYAAFLDHAARLILLRRVGGSYTFIHRYLLEYFAALEPDKADRQPPIVPRG
ncbi:MAG: protein kinase [Chloroflexota bacterium]